MINRIKSLIQENRQRQQKIFLRTRELEWAQFFSDSIKGKDYLQNLSINRGTYAGNYSFLYVLNRILMDYKPSSILELGLGETSKLISTYLDNYLLDSKHVILEHSEEWINNFKQRFTLSERSRIELVDLEEIEIRSNKTKIYKNFDNFSKEKFDLYIIDGPKGSKRFSRFNIAEQAKTFNNEDEFIIIIDDYNRRGEQETAQAVLEVLKTKGIEIFTKSYQGVTSQLVISSKKYKFAASL